MLILNLFLEVEGYQVAVYLQRVLSSLCTDWDGIVAAVVVAVVTCVSVGN